MKRFILSRAISAIVLLFVISLVSFGLIFASGDPATQLAGEAGSAADAERLRELYGLDRPFLSQYAHWLWAVAHGNFGHSLYFDQPVTNLILSRLPHTLMLGTFGMTLAIAIAIPLGILAACWRGTIIDRAVILLSVVSQAMPTFWFALLLIIYLSVQFPIFPSSGLSSPGSYVLPTIVLALYSLPELIRLTRSGMITALESDFIRTAWAMGLGRGRVYFLYALRNALIPVMGLAAAQFGNLLAGSVIVESIFAIPGAGRLAWESLLRTDLATIQALILCFSTIYILLTLLADIVNASLDPRIRLGS